MAGRERGVVEKGPSGNDMIWLGVVHRHVADLGAARRVDDRDGIIETRQHVESAAGLIEHHATWAAARDRDLVRGVRGKGVFLELVGVVYADLTRAKHRYIQGGAVRGNRHV